MSPHRRWIWSWTIPAALSGWVATGALLLGSITACAREVIESGIVREEVWINSRSILAIASTLASGWVLAYSSWARRRGHFWIVDVVFCAGVGATAWVIPYVGLAYTVGDYWQNGSVESGISRLGEGSCGLSIDPVATFLTIGGFSALMVWIIYALTTHNGRAERSAALHSLNSDQPVH